MPADRRRGEERAQARAARRPLPAGDIVEPDRDGEERQGRPGMRLDDEHAGSAEGRRVRLHDVRRRHQDAREEVVEDRRHRGPARQDRRRDEGDDQREDAEAAERGSRAEADDPGDEGPQRVLRRRRRWPGRRVPDGRRPALRPHLQGGEARRLRGGGQVSLGRAVRDHAAQGRARVRAARRPDAERDVPERRSAPHLRALVRHPGPDRPDEPAPEGSVPHPEYLSGVSLTRPRPGDRAAARTACSATAGSRSPSRGHGPSSVASRIFSNSPAKRALTRSGSGVSFRSVAMPKRTAPS